MKVQYNNLYTHFVFISYNRLPLIDEKNRDRIEKYITGIINKLFQFQKKMLIEFVNTF